MRVPLLEKPLYDGVQKLYRFRNGYGASVVRHHISFGSENGLWELAAIRWFPEEDAPHQHSIRSYEGWVYTLADDPDDDIQGYLDLDAVEVLLNEIELRPAAEEDPTWLKS